MSATSTSPVTPQTLVGEIVAGDPATARIFEALRIDFCCGGRRPLAEACQTRGLDPLTVVELVNAAGRLTDAAAGGEHDLTDASIGGICDHVVTRHHDPTRVELARIAELADKVERAHASVRPQLSELRIRFGEVRGELEAHMESEERTLFPACRGEGDPVSGPELEALLAEHESEHDGIGAELTIMRELAGDYDESAALCNTHRVLMHSLRDLEAATHQHVHEENNVLFPRVRAALTAR